MDNYNCVSCNSSSTLFGKAQCRTCFERYLKMGRPDHSRVRTYLKILAVVAALSFISGYASAEMPTIRGSMERSLPYERDYQEQQVLRNQMQRRMNQQYYNDRLQNEIQNQQNEMYYQQHQEHMRNQGWGRSGLDDGGRR